MENKKMNTKGAGTLTNYFVVIIIGSLALMTMFLFYGAIFDNYDYLDLSNYSNDKRFFDITTKANESFNDLNDKSVEMQQQYTDSEGTDDTGSDSMILNSFSLVKSLFKNIFKLTWGTASAVTTSLNINPMWFTAIISLTVIVILIAIIGGFLKAKW